MRDAVFETSEGSPRSKGDYIQVGDTYRWLWFGHGEDVFEEGEVLELDGSSLIRFTFSGCLVTVELSLVDNTILVELTQEDIPPEDDPEKNLYVRCSIGWTYFLTILKSVLEGGLDLREKD